MKFKLWTISDSITTWKRLMYPHIYDECYEEDVKEFGKSWIDDGLNSNFWFSLNNYEGMLDG